MQKYDRRKFLRNISFATTGLLILPSAITGSRIWKPSHTFVCEVRGYDGAVCLGRRVFPKHKYLIYDRLKNRLTSSDFLPSDRRDLYTYSEKDGFGVNQICAKMRAVTVEHGHIYRINDTDFTFA